MDPDPGGKNRRKKHRKNAWKLLIIMILLSFQNLRYPYSNKNQTVHKIFLFKVLESRRSFVKLDPHFKKKSWVLICKKMNAESLPWCQHMRYR